MQGCRINFTSNPFLCDFRLFLPSFEQKEASSEGDSADSPNGPALLQNRLEGNGYLWVFGHFTKNSELREEVCPCSIPWKPTHSFHCDSPYTQLKFVPWTLCCSGLWKHSVWCYLSLILLLRGSQVFLYDHRPSTLPWTLCCSGLSARKPQNKRFYPPEAQAPSWHSSEPLQVTVLATREKVQNRRGEMPSLDPQSQSYLLANLGVPQISVSTSSQFPISLQSESEKPNCFRNSDVGFACAPS